MLTETEARTAALAALKKLSAARSGRLHAELIARPGIDIDGLTSDLVSTSDTIFNLDQPAYMTVNEASNKTTSSSSGAIEVNLRELREARIFPAESLIYQRVIREFLRTEEAGTDVVFDNTAQADTVRWIVLTRDLLRDESLSQMRPGMLAFPDLEALIENPEQKTVVTEDQIGQTLFDLPTEAEQISQLLKLMRITDCAPEIPLRVRLVIGTHGLDRLTLFVPYAHTDSFLDLIDSVVLRFWRMGEEITIEKPDPLTCFPPIPALSTTITACNLKSSDRYLSFVLDGRQYTDRVFWSANDDQSYVPLAVGDQLRITGSRRPFFRTKANKALTFNLWAAWRADDDRLIQDFRKDEYSHVSARFLAHYRRTTDVIDQVVTLTAVRPVEEPVEIIFADALVGENDQENSLEVERSDLDDSGASPGAPVIVHGFNSPMGVQILQVELANGALLG